MTKPCVSVCCVLAETRNEDINFPFLTHTLNIHKCQHTLTKGGEINGPSSGAGAREHFPDRHQRRLSRPRVGKAYQVSRSSSTCSQSRSEVSSSHLSFLFLLRKDRRLVKPGCTLAFAVILEARNLTWQHENANGVVLNLSENGHCAFRVVATRAKEAAPVPFFPPLLHIKNNNT
jgi:hypothetical protein